jgi:hypothetical protein
MFTSAGFPRRSTGSEGYLRDFRSGAAQVRWVREAVPVAADAKGVARPPGSRRDRPERGPTCPPVSRGADWWVAGAVAASAEDAYVELEEVERFCGEHDLRLDVV